MVKLKNYSLVSGTYQLKYTATHSKVPGYSVESALITVAIQNDCSDGTVFLNSYADNGKVIAYKNSVFNIGWTDMLSEVKCKIMTKDLILKFNLKSIRYGSTTVVDASTNNSL